MELYTSLRVCLLVIAVVLRDGNLEVKTETQISVHMPESYQDLTKLAKRNQKWNQNQEPRKVE
jgi:hypothetical protein